MPPPLSCPARGCRQRQPPSAPPRMPPATAEARGRRRLARLAGLPLGVDVGLESLRRPAVGVAASHRRRMACCSGMGPGQAKAPGASGPRVSGRHAPSPALRGSPRSGLRGIPVEPRRRPCCLGPGCHLADGQPRAPAQAVNPRPLPTEARIGGRPPRPGTRAAGVQRERISRAPARDADPPRGWPRPSTWGWPGDLVE